MLIYIYKALRTWTRDLRITSPTNHKATLQTVPQALSTSETRGLNWADQMEKSCISLRVFYYDLQFSNIILCVRKQVHGFLLHFVDLLLL